MGYVSKEKAEKTVAEHQRLLGWARLVRHLGISMSVISDLPVETRLQPNGGQVPAATGKRTTYRWKSGKDWGESVDGFSTTFYGNRLPDVDNLGVWLGVAWHEMGHVLWSPYEKKNLRISTALNLLEDARIEGLLLGTYPNTRASLMAALAWLMNQGSKAEQGVFNARYQYAWVVGRLHVDRKIRQKFRALVEPDIAKEIEEIFTKYLGMGVKFRPALATSLSDRLQHLLGEDARNYRNHICESMTSESAAATYGEADGQMPESYEEDINSLGEGSGGEGEDPSNDTPSAGGDSDSEPSAGAGAGDTEGESQDDAPTRTQASRTRLERAKTQRQIDKLREDMTKALEEEAAKDSDLQQEVSTLERMVMGAGGVAASRGGSLESATVDQMAIARKIRQIATGFNDDSGKGLVRRRDHGRIKPMRYERTGDLDSAYDGWEPGLEQEMYVGMLMDVSGSMQGSPVNEVVFGLEQGLADVATVETVYFNQGFWIGAGQSTPSRAVRVSPHGGTDPSEGMGYLYHRMRTRSEVNKMFILYTDGSFNDASDVYIVAAYCDKLIEEGVTVCLMANETGHSQVRMVMHNARHITPEDVYQIKDLKDLPPIVLSWTKRVLSKPIGGYHA